MNPSALAVATTTFSEKSDATDMAQRLIRERLAGCAQVEGPIESHYRWKGQLCQETEWRLTIKTTAAAVPRLTAVVHQHHPYEQPQWAVVAVQSTSDTYGNWILENVAAAGSGEP